MFDSLEKLLRKHLGTADTAHFVAVHVAGVKCAPGYQLTYENAISEIVCACQKNGACCALVLNVLQAEELQQVVQTFNELKVAAQEIRDLSRQSASKQLFLFGSIVADKFPTEQAVYAYLRVHTAPYYTMNCLRACLSELEWHDGAMEDSSSPDRKGFLFKVAETLWHVCLSLAQPAKPLVHVVGE